MNLTLTATSTITATAYADDWIREKLEPSAARTRLSGKDGIYDTYLMDCERDNQPALSRIMLSKKLELCMALEHNILLTKIRGREGLIIEGIRVKPNEEG